MRYILVTGVSTGIGYAIVQYFLQKDYFVIGSVRKAADATRLEEEFGPKFKAVQFDVADDLSIKKALPIVEDIVGSTGLTALINNAGIAVFGPLQHIDVEKVRHQLDVNVLGVIRVTQTFLTLLGAQKNSTIPPGKIFNISSVSGKLSSPFLGPYCSSKFALEAITDSLRRELLIYGIDVISIQPGPVKSDIWAKVQNDDGNYDDTDYAELLARSDKQVEKTEKTAIEAVRVAETIHKALILKRPKTRYIVANNSFFYKFVSMLPDRLVDGSFKKQFAKTIKKDA